jgi:hypothetical protein
MGKIPVNEGELLIGSSSKSTKLKGIKQELKMACIEKHLNIIENEEDQ